MFKKIFAKIRIKLYLNKCGLFCTGCYTCAHDYEAYRHTHETHNRRHAFELFIRDSKRSPKSGGKAESLESEELTSN